jgi:hypothetical protein
MLADREPPRPAILVTGTARSNRAARLALRARRSRQAFHRTKPLGDLPAADFRRIVFITLMPFERARFSLIVPDIASFGA